MVVAIQKNFVWMNHKAWRQEFKKIHKLWVKSVLGQADYFILTGLLGHELITVLQNCVIHTCRFLMNNWTFSFAKNALLMHI